MRRGAASGSLPPSHSLPARPSAGGRVDGQRAAHGRGPASARFPAFGGEPSQAASAETRSPTRATSWSNRSRPERCRGERAGRRSRVVEAKPQRDFWLSEGGSRGRPKSLVAASELRRGATAAVRSGAAATVRSGEAASLRRSLSAISGFRRGASREPSEELRSPTTAASWSRRRCPGLRRGGSAKARATAVGHRWGATSNARSCPSREVAPALGLRRRALLLPRRAPARSPRPGRRRRWGLRRLGNRSREASAGAKGFPLPGSRATGAPSGLPAASSQPPSTRCSPTTRSCPRCDASAQVGAAPKRLRVGAAAASRQRLAPQSVGRHEHAPG